MMQQRNYSIDTIKGFLILCVVIGHVLLGTLDENIVRWVIYSFHMPLFMFMSGYMINLTKLSSQSYKEVLGKYWNRMIKMWLIAFSVFTLYQILCEPSIRNICSLLYSPWYHLWYVPTLFCYILLAKYLFGRTQTAKAYGILLLIYIIWNIIKVEIAPFPMTKWCELSNLPYFAIGLFFKNHLSDNHFNKSYRIVPVLFIPAILSTRLIDIPTYGILSFILVLLVIAYFLYPSIKNDSLPKSKVLTYIGENSLNIYLWHMIIQPLKDYVSNTSIYYGITFSLLIIFLAVIKLKPHKQNCR